MATRRHIYLSETEWELLEELKMKHQLKSISATVSFLLDNYSDSMSGITQAQMVASLVKSELKEYYDTLRVRTGYTDKHTKLLLHMLNDIVINQGWDLPPDGSSASIEGTPSLLYTDAQKHYDDMLKRFNEQKQLKSFRGNGGVANE
ncbi:hypothetical protein NHG25_05935 [Aerococcaceae bacterium NML191292]|nr:hypothetical protein [Aerococcaceae bacterium NML191292]MCW6681868.1 hypothetical protein [Aerococcaceae bacterium NML160702]